MWNSNSIPDNSDATTALVCGNENACASQFGGGAAPAKRAANQKQHQQNDPDNNDATAVSRRLRASRQVRQPMAALDSNLLCKHHPQLQLHPYNQQQHHQLKRHDNHHQDVERDSIIMQTSKDCETLIASSEAAHQNKKLCSNAHTNANLSLKPPHPAPPLLLPPTNKMFKPAPHSSIEITSSLSHTSSSLLLYQGITSYSSSSSTSSSATTASKSERATRAIFRSRGGTANTTCSKMTQSSSCPQSSPYSVMPEAVSQSACELQRLETELARLTAHTHAIPSWQAHEHCRNTIRRVYAQRLRHHRLLELQQQRLKQNEKEQCEPLRSGLPVIKRGRGRPPSVIAQHQKLLARAELRHPIRVAEAFWYDQSSLDVIIAGDGEREELRVNEEEEQQVCEEWDQSGSKWVRTSSSGSVFLVRNSRCRLIDQMQRADLQHTHANTNSQLDTHTHMHRRTRCALIDWVYRVHACLGLSNDTLFLAVSILQRYLVASSASSSSSSVMKKQQNQRDQLAEAERVCMACLLIACKMEEVNPPEVEELAACAEQPIRREPINTQQTKQQQQEEEVCGAVFQLEIEVLRGLQFEGLCAPSALQFVRQLCHATRADDFVYAMAKFLCELDLSASFVGQQAAHTDKHTHMYTHTHAVPANWLASAAFLLALLLIRNEDDAADYDDDDDDNAISKATSEKRSELEARLATLWSPALQCVSGLLLASVRPVLLRLAATALTRLDGVASECGEVEVSRANQLALHMRTGLEQRVANIATRRTAAHTNNNNDDVCVEGVASSSAEETANCKEQEHKQKQPIRAVLMSCDSGDNGDATIMPVMPVCKYNAEDARHLGVAKIALTRRALLKLLCQPITQPITQPAS